MSTSQCLVAHADWSMAANKRWIAVASPAGSCWRVRVEPVGPIETLLARLRHEAGSEPVLFGVDAPIGLPLAYAEQHASQSRDFPEFLRSLTDNQAFFDVCRTIEEVTGARPFFPHHGRGGPRRAEHAARLGVAGHDALMRRCDRAKGRRPAASLFWTLGANQVGKAALTLWRELLLPGSASEDPPGLWPFDGNLHPLLRGRSVTIAETYPAQALRQLQPRWPGSKRRQADRVGFAPTILTALEELRAQPVAGLLEDVRQGFDHGATGEDQFDSVLGLLALLKVVSRPGEEFAPPDENVRKWEGWIMGQRHDDGVASF